MNKNTLFINVLGGPGSGKSIVTAEVYAALKRRGITAEVVQEEIKWRIYGSGDVKDQLGIVQNQADKLEFVKGKVDVALADGNLIHNAIYNRLFEHDSDVEVVEQVILERSQTFAHCLNVFLVRDANAPFEKVGRFHDRLESIEKDNQIMDHLHETGTSYIKVPMTQDGLEMVSFVKYLDKNLEAINSGQLSLDKVYSDLNHII